MTLPVSACLLSWRRPDNLRLIVESLAPLEFLDEILVWNINPEVRLSFSLPKVRVINSPENRGCAARYLCAAHARNEIIYTQDDDALVLDVVQRYQAFLADPSRITHGLSEWHYPRPRLRLSRRAPGDAGLGIVLLTFLDSGAGRAAGRGPGVRPVPS